MKKILITLSILASVLTGFAQQSIEPNQKNEVFFGPGVKATITKLPFTNQPEYFGGGNGNPYASDFPYCFVKIDGEYWTFYKSGEGPTVFRWKGTNIENGKRQPNGFASFPVTRPYMLGGMWYDSTEHKLYAPMHCEYYDQPLNKLTGAYDYNPLRQIHLASSTDKGLTWKYEGPIVTRDAPGVTPLKPCESSGRYWDGGAGDFFIYVDEPGGYVYLYAGSYIQNKKEFGHDQFIRHQVARCAMKDMGNPNAWHKFYNGKWDEPGLGGKASYVNAYYVMYNTYLKKYLGFNYGGGLAVCTDMDKQDWSPIFRIKGEYWGSANEQAWHVTALDKVNIFSGGQSLYLYSYWGAGDRPVAKLYQIDLSKGQENSGTQLYSLEGSLRTSVTSTDPSIVYPIDPLYNSPDPIESRHTRRVHCTHPETKYTGVWRDEQYDKYSEKAVKASGTVKNGIGFSFRGADIYWRAVKGPDCGLADVYIDGMFQKTVDCYSDPKTAEQIAFMKTGLDPKVAHTVKVVVRGEKNEYSAGVNIKHLLFEYAAESYRASDGFSSIQGKNGWYYQEKTGKAYSDLRFEEGKWWVGSTCENEFTYQNAIWIYDAMVVKGDVARKWVAPHDGTVRIEGNLRFSEDWSNWKVGDVSASILVNEKETWKSETIKIKAIQTHDFDISINKGDAIYFVLHGSCQTNPANVAWHPVITYVDGTGEMK